MQRYLSAVFFQSNKIAIKQPVLELSKQEKSISIFDPLFLIRKVRKAFESLLALLKLTIFSPSREQIESFAIDFPDSRIFSAILFLNLFSQYQNFTILTILTIFILLRN